MTKHDISSSEAFQPSQEPVQVKGLTVQNVNFRITDRDQPFVGRRAFADELKEHLEGTVGGIAHAEIRAPGGVGKTAFVSSLLHDIADGKLRPQKGGFEKIFLYSLYSQGNRSQPISGDQFIDELLTFLGHPQDRASRTMSSDQKGELAARLATEQNVLVYLDGIEPSQSHDGLLGDAALQSFIATVRLQGEKLHLISSSRIKLAGLGEHTEEKQLYRDLELMTPEEAVELLRELGVTGRNEHLQELANACERHSYAVALLGRYITAFEGSRVTGENFETLRTSMGEELLVSEMEEVPGRKAWRVMELFMEQFGADSAEAEVLRLLGLFDRPIEPTIHEYLREETEIPGLTEVLQGLEASDWEELLQKLKEYGLIVLPNGTGSGEIDAQPLVREYFDAHLLQHSPEQRKAGHAAIFAHTRDIIKRAEGFPETVKAVEETYASIRHAVRAGDLSGAVELLETQLWRFNDGENCFFPSRILGMPYSDLIAIESILEADKKLSLLSERQLLALKGDQANRYRALGAIDKGEQILQEVVEKFRGEIEPEEEELSDAFCKQALYPTITYGELLLTRGKFDEAKDVLLFAKQLAEQVSTEVVKNRDHFRVQARTALGELHLFRGEIDKAETCFTDAEEVAEQSETDIDITHSQSGYRFTAFAAQKGRQGEILHRAKTGPWGAARKKSSALSVAIDSDSVAVAEHMELLRLGTAASPQNLDPVLDSFQASVEGFKRAPYRDYAARGSLHAGRFYLYAASIDLIRREQFLTLAEEQLQHSLVLAQNGRMDLIEMPTRVALARLYHTKEQPEKAAPHTERARKLEQLGHKLFSEELS
ncbi:NACHT domain-containing protein [bacterium]|nr:NACHT domain-containing protein [bacterium]